MIRKCRKPKILQEIHLKSVDYSKYIAVVDMGLSWQLSTPSSADTKKRMGQSTDGKIIGKKFLKQ